MWFKSGKNFKENAEDKTLLFTITQNTLHSFDKISNFENHQNRGLFIDELLNEPNMKFIRLMDEEIVEIETLLTKMENVGLND